jgi:selenocysteine lyase/cysteine desulfurase
VRDDPGPAELSRRDLVARAGVAAAAVALGRPAVAEAAPDLRRWSAVRAQFALDPRRIHLASFLLAAHPRPVREAIERHRRGLDRDAVTYLHTNEGRLTEEARSAAGRYLGVPADEVALTDSTTMGLGLLYARLALRPDDEVLTSEHDFYATHEALRLSGATVRRVRLYDDPRRASADEIVTRLRRGVSGRTRVVALTWVHSSTGVKLPIRAIADALPERVLLCVDGVHGFGSQAATARDLRCDAFASGCHKWLYGPRGTGVLWASSRVRELVRPTIPSFDDGASYGAWLSGTTPAGIPDGARLTPGGFHSFEHRWALAEAFRFHDAIGHRRIAARVRALVARLQAGLSEIRGVRLRTPSSGALSAGLVCFEVAGIDPGTVVDRLAARRIVASVTPYAQRYVRLGPGIVNTPAEVDAAVRAVAAL